VPTEPLPFPAIVVASHNDPWIGQHAARRLARGWGARFEDMGEAGHINAQSGLGAWPQGQAWLDELIAGRVAPAIVAPLTRRPHGAIPPRNRLDPSESFP
jgi:hypothetical protein